jgi:hypothetical protein
MRHRHFLGRFVSLLAAAALVGCGGGGGGSSAPAEPQGTVQVAVIDAPSDELDRFEVDIVRIDLVKLNGARVSTLPLTTRVDFADLVEVAELLTAASVPRGTYIEASMTLDFSTAAVHIAGAAANAAVLGEDGEPLDGEVTVAVRFDSARRLVVEPLLVRVLTLDFDLDAATTVDEAANTVTLSPIVVADIDLERPFIHRVRGPLRSVDLEDGSFVISLRPFRVRRSRFGELEAFVSNATSYEIDGVRFVGEAGLRAMASLPPLTAVSSVGVFQGDLRAFHAVEVLAGSSVPGGTLDIVRGHVTARNGDVLTVTGAQLDRSNGSITHNATATVVLDPGSTRVVRQFSTAPQTIDAVSVGQLICAFGELTGAPGSYSMSPARRVRLHRTRLAGVARQVGPGSLVLEAQRFGVRRASLFDFTGTGPEGQPADPSRYEIVTGSLSLAGIAAGTPLRVFGFVAPFGAAPPDFEAITLVDVSDVGAVLSVVWTRDSDEQIVLDTESIGFDFTDSPTVHHVERAGTRIDLTELPEVSLEPRDDSRGRFVISDGHMTTVFLELDPFLAELERRFDSGRDVRRITAVGRFDDASGVLTAASITAVVK